MTKQEFLNELKQALSGEVSPEAMMDAYSYYSGYMDEQMRSGKTEEQVTEELGKPFMLARSIIAAQTRQREADVEYTEDGRTRRVSGWENWKGQRPEKEKRKEFVFDMNAWYTKVIGIAFLIVMVCIVFFVIKVGLWVLVTFGIPILLVLGILYLLLYFLG